MESPAKGFLIEELTEQALCLAKLNATILLFQSSKDGRPADFVHSSKGKFIEDLTLQDTILFLYLFT